MSQSLSVKTVSQADLEQLDVLTKSLPQGSSLAVLLQYMLAAMARGADVTVFDSDAELTPNEAADLLHMSRPHLLKLMDRGELEFHRVGSHRRICMPHLLDFIDRRERAKAAVAEASGNSAAIIKRVRDKAGVLNQADIDALNTL